MKLTLESASSFFPGEAVYAKDDTTKAPTASYSGQPDALNRQSKVNQTATTKRTLA
jgi:hypothetical protein